MVKVDESYLFSTEKVFPSNAIKDKIEQHYIVYSFMLLLQSIA